MKLEELGKKINWGKVAGAAGLVLSVGATLLSNKAQEDTLKKQAEEVVKKALSEKQ